MNIFELKKLLCTLMVLVSACTVMAHKGTEHSLDIGEVLGLRNFSREPITGKRKELNDVIGQQIAFLVDNQAQRLYKELNSIIRKELQKDAFFHLLPEIAKSKDEYFANELKKNKNYLNRHEDQKNLSWAAEHLNWISLSMTRLPFYSDSDIKDISDEIYSKRNNYKPESSHKLMKTFLFQKNKQITNIIDQYKRFQPQLLKYQLDRWEKDQRFFNWGNYSHRIFFHWGYNLQTCRDHTPIREKIQESMIFIKENLVSNQSVDTLNIAAKLYLHIDQVWLETKGKVHRRITGKIEDINEVDVNDEVADVILSIAYNVHILGDYSGTVIGPLVSIDKICPELIACLEKLDVNKTGRRYRIVVENAINSIAQKNKSSDRQKAEELLKVLKQEVPRLIKNTSQYKKALWGKAI